MDETLDLRKIEREGNWWSTPGAVSVEELGLAARNHGMPLEMLRQDVTPLGLHYLLIHFDIPSVDRDVWQLEIDGRVLRPLHLGLDELRARPRITETVTMECAGNGRARIAERMKSQPWLEEAVGTAVWTGTPLGTLLEEAGIESDAVEVVATGLDRGIQGGIEQDYERSLPLSEALRPDVLLVYEVNGQPLPPQHGFPLRLVVPGWYGMTNVKWLKRIRVVSEPFQGFQQVNGYTIRTSPEDTGIDVTRMQPRSLILPPGIPEFISRVRYVSRGEEILRGRAWSGWGPIAKVEVSVDAGDTWTDAKLGQPAGQYSWTPWWYRWNPQEPGDYELRTRASDAVGNVQPFLSSGADNPQGLANNDVQRVHVVVR